MGFNKSEKKEAENFLTNKGYYWNSDHTHMTNGSKSATFSPSGQSMTWDGTHYNDKGYKKSHNLK